MLRTIAFVASGILVVYLALKVADLFLVGAVPHLLAMTWESYMYLGEVFLTAVLPLLLILHPKVRRSPAGLGVAAGSTALGMVWNRLNVGVFGYFRDAGTVYFPSLTEWALSLGILAAAGMAFLYACEYLPIFDDAWRERQQRWSASLPSFDRLSGVWNRVFASGLRRTSTLAMLTVPLAWAVLYPPFAGGDRAEDRITAPLADDSERTVLNLDGNRRLLAVSFPHKEHQTRLGGEASCTTCHHLSLPNDHSTPCSRCHQHMTGATNIFDHTAHMRNVAVEKDLRGVVPANNSCAVCHEPAGPKQASTAVTCLDCHDTNMRPTHTSEDPHLLEWASGYRVAMHKTCIACHLKERERVGRPELAECATCHEDRRPISPVKSIASLGIPMGM